MRREPEGATSVVTQVALEGGFWPSLSLTPPKVPPSIRTRGSQYTPTLASDFLLAANTSSSRCASSFNTVTDGLRLDIRNPHDDAGTPSASPIVLHGCNCGETNLG
jgi:hypothetical protein